MNQMKRELSVVSEAQSNSSTGDLRARAARSRLAGRLKYLFDGYGISSEEETRCDKLAAVAGQTTRWARALLYPESDTSFELSLSELANLASALKIDLGLLLSKYPIAAYEDTYAIPKAGGGDPMVLRAYDPKGEAWKVDTEKTAVMYAVVGEDVEPGFGFANGDVLVMQSEEGPCVSGIYFTTPIILNNQLNLLVKVMNHEGRSLVKSPLLPTGEMIVGRTQQGEWEDKDSVFRSTMWMRVVKIVRDADAYMK